ncbi:hypothetical protein CDAR_102691 [Caerostris darwini]|uniref:Uncharacterized protein n=1 Tax=Caerostris darwini TaxID=1538125 RepID=A0AAV4WQS6_9ARAC|nr:hypothetical protein CDAR_102691 [Caerostris darwini]
MLDSESVNEYEDPRQSNARKETQSPLFQLENYLYLSFSYSYDERPLSKLRVMLRSAATHRQGKSRGKAAAFPPLINSVF